MLGIVQQNQLYYSSSIALLGSVVGLVFVAHVVVVVVIVVVVVMNIFFCLIFVNLGSWSWPCNTTITKYDGRVKPVVDIVIESIARN